MAKAKLTKVESHPIFMNLAVAMAQYVVKNGDLSGERPISRTPEQIYVGSVLREAFNLSERFQQINDALIYLRRHKSVASVVSMRRELKGYLVFHIEGYYLRVASIRDYSWKFVNTSLQLGLPDRLTSIVPEMERVKTHKFGKIITALSSDLKKTSEVRNQIVHRYGYQDEKLATLGTVELAVRGSDDFETSNVKISVSAYSAQIAEQALTGFSAINAKIENHIESLLTEAYKLIQKVEHGYGDVDS